ARPTPRQAPTPRALACARMARILTPNAHVSCRIARTLCPTRRITAPAPTIHARGSLMATLQGVSITWLGHGPFLITTPEGKQVLIGPFLANNPSCPEQFHEPEVDAILITHGHADHIADVFTAHQRCAGPIIGIFDLTTWLGT